MKLAGLALLVFAGSLRAENIDAKAMARKIRQSVVLIVIRDDAGHQLGSATGFVVSGDGKLISNRHVSSAGSRLFAKAWNGRLYPVTGVIAEDPEQDLVLLTSEASGLPPLPLGSSTSLVKDAPVVVVGNPLGLDGTATPAKVTGFRDFSGGRRWIELSPLEDASAGFEKHVAQSGEGLQVMTPITFGSSGSPVVNAAGEVVGIISMARGLSYARAVPVEVARGLLSGKVTSVSPAPRNRNQEDLSLDRDFIAGTRALQAGNYDDAVRFAKNAVARFPNSANAYVLLGQACGQQRDYNASLTAFERALQLRPNSAEAWYGLTLAHAMLGNIDKARDALRELQKLDADWAKSLSDTLPQLGR